MMPVLLWTDLLVFLLIACGAGAAGDQQEDEQVGPQQHGHHCSLTRGSTRVYDRSVSSRPTM